MTAKAHGGVPQSILAVGCPWCFSQADFRVSRLLGKSRLGLG
ncbi:putative lipoprotein [Myxococcus xanthus DK 1622]|uniref:Lipoprotein n=1 Tax=Myxococcus xanthus (strain DK1622) TaxID=246197 RepID=Q1DG13_MYXXD|nr:putative lipoprotein [Myxococcus xanthus DK 1622]